MTTSRRDFLRGSIAGAAVLGAGGLLTACGDDDEEPVASGDTSGSGTAAAQKLAVMMPFPLSPNFIADVAAISGGFMDDVGVELDLQFSRGAPQALQQLAGGNVTVIRNGPVETVQAMVKEDAPFITIGMVNQRTNYTLTSLPDAALALAGLGGKRVGLPTLGGNAEFTIDLLLRSEGLDPASVERQAVGLEASSFGSLQESLVDAILVPRSTVAGIRALGEEIHVDLLEEVNPLLGTNLVSTEEFVEERREAIVAYLEGLHATMLALNDETQVEELLPKVTSDWDLPQLADIERGKPIVKAIVSRWFEDGEENLLRNIPDRWEEGIDELVGLDYLPEGTEVDDLYTNDLLDEATS